MSYKDFINEGEFIILEMKCGDVFEGDVVNVGQNLCELVNVRQYNNCNKLQGVYTFYRNEIGRVFKLQSKLINSEDNPVSPKLYRISVLDRKEYDQLKCLSESFIFLENADNRYYKAIKDLEDSETISVVPLGLDNSISTDIKLLAICNHQQVYIFEMADLKERYFYPELKEIFECALICKVFHGGMAFVEVLNTMYNVYTTNIFDTQITDLYLEKINACGKTPKKAKTLAKCIKEYLMLPSSIIKIPESRSRLEWSNRPLCDKDKVYASQLCIYLLKLQQTMKKILLKNTYKTISTVHQHVYNLSDTNFEEYLQSNKITGAINELIPTENEKFSL